MSTHENRFNLTEFLLVVFGALALILAFYGRYLDFYEPPSRGDHTLTLRLIHEHKNTAAKIFDFRYISGHGFTDAYYNPFVWLIYHFMDRFEEGKQYYFRWFMFGMHALNTAMIYYVSKFFFLKRGAAILAAVLFILCRHTIKTVVWIPASAHLTASFFIAMSLLAYGAHLRKKYRGCYALACLSMFLAWCAKPSAIFLLPILFMADLYLRIGNTGLRARILQALRSLWPMLIIQICFVAIEAFRFPHAALANAWGGLYWDVNSFYKLFEFLGILILPLRIMGSWEAAVYFAMFLVICAALLYGTGTARFLVVWALLALTPFLVSNFHQTSTLSRYLYYAYMPFCMFIAHVLHEASRKHRHAALWLVLPVVISALINMKYMLQGTRHLWW